MSTAHGLDVLLLCTEEDLQPWQKAIFERHKEAEKKHEEAIEKYKVEMRKFYAGMGVSYNKRNGEASAMEQQVSESNNGVTRLVTTLPVTQSPIVHPIGAPPSIGGTISQHRKPMNKIITPSKPLPSPIVPQLHQKQFQAYKATPPPPKPAPVMTAVKPIPKPAMKLMPKLVLQPPTNKPGVVLKPPPQPMVKLPAKRPLEDKPSSSSEKRQMVENISKLDKHYGFKKGKAIPNEDGDRKFRIKCFHCDSVLPNNVLYMEHIRKYLHISRKSTKDSHLFCDHCFKRFKSGPDLESHCDRYHSTTNKYYCKICDYSFKSKSILKSHLQGVHDPLSMPYVCKVCQYRTSSYKDIISHFMKGHKGAKALLCPHCLKVLRCSRSYLQHCQRHFAILLKNHGTFNCPCCKLQFLSSTERNEHVQNDHKKLKVHDKDGVPSYQPTIFTKPIIKPPKPPSKKSKPAPVVVPISPRTRRVSVMECLECGGGYDNLKDHLPSQLRCSSCSYITFCSSAFAQHTIVFHSSFKAPPKVHPVKKVYLNDGQPSLTCKKCGFSTLACPIMAWHTISCSKGASSCESFVYLKLRQKKLFAMEDTNFNTDKEVIEILSDGE